MASVTSASRYITSVPRYHPRYQSRTSMYIRGLIPRNFAELAKAVLIGATRELFHLYLVGVLLLLQTRAVDLKVLETKLLKVTGQASLQSS